MVDLPAGVTDVVDSEGDFAAEDCVVGIEPFVLCAGTIEVVAPDGAAREAAGVC